MLFLHQQFSRFTLSITHMFKSGNFSFPIFCSKMLGLSMSCAIKEPHYFVVSSSVTVVLCFPLSENYSRVTASLSALCTSHPPHPLVAAINSSLNKILPTHHLLVLRWATVLKSLSFSDPSYWFTLIESDLPAKRGTSFYDLENK